MEEAELLNILKNIQKVQTEKRNIEVKSANLGCPDKFYDTISAFSNQDEGGTLIFGVSENNNFQIVGVYDAKDLQKRISNTCEAMTPKVRANISILCPEGKKVVVVEVPGVDYELRPVFYTPRGKMGGSYVRVGDSDEQMTSFEIYNYDSYKGHMRDDIRVPEDSEWKLLNKDRLYKYLFAVKKERVNLSHNVADEEILELMGVTKNGKPTLAGIMVFSDYPQSFFPNYTINAVRVPGNEIGDLGKDNERFTNNKKITGSIPDMIDLAIDFVYNNQKIKTIINEKGKREDKPEYPIKAVREAILNAVVHRDYSKYSEYMPITLNMYDNRLEITNPGGLWGRISIDKLGRVLPETRNAALADILELLDVTENRYSGIPTMRTEMKQMELSDPEFVNVRGEFKTIFYNKRIIDEKEGSISDRILAFCGEPRTREEIVAMSGMSRYYVINKVLKSLIDQGKIGMTNPDSPQSKNQKFFSK